MNCKNIAKSFCLAVIVAAPQLFAHTSPVEMTPAANSTVSAPANIAIRFSSALEAKFSQITVTNAEGHVVNNDPSVCSGDKLTMTVAVPQLPAGIYTVHWVGVSADTHRSQGEYKFTVK